MKKVVISLFALGIFALLIFLLLRPSATSHEKIDQSSPPTSGKAAVSVTPKLSETKAKETVVEDQARVDAELASIPYNEAGEVTASSSGKKVLSIDGKKILEAFDFSFRDRHPSGFVLIGARTEPGKPLDQFDVATDIVNGKAAAASQGLWLLAKDGTIQRITTPDLSVQAARMSKSGDKLAYSAIERDANGFKSQMSLFVLDVKTGTTKKIFHAVAPGSMLTPVSWKSDDTLRVFTASEHGGSMKIEDVRID